MTLWHLHGVEVFSQQTPLPVSHHLRVAVTALEHLGSFRPLAIAFEAFVFLVNCIFVVFQANHPQAAIVCKHSSPTLIPSSGLLAIPPEALARCGLYSAGRQAASATTAADGVHALHRGDGELGVATLVGQRLLPGDIRCGDEARVVVGETSDGEIVRG